jgi:ATP:corrinoid adenosyltransferase
MQLTVARPLTAVTAVLGDVAEADGESLAIELAQFMKELGPKEAGALEMKKKFQKLADDVILFNAKIDDALQKAEANIKADLEDARTRVASLTQELEAYVFAFLCTMPY